MAQVPSGTPEFERLRIEDTASGRIAAELRYAKYCPFEDVIATEIGGLYGQTRFGRSLLAHAMTITPLTVRVYAPEYADVVLTRDVSRYPLNLGGLLALHVETARDTEAIQAHIRDSQVAPPIAVDAAAITGADIIRYSHQRDHDFLRLSADLQQAVSNAAKAAITGTGSGYARGFSERQFRHGYALVYMLVDGIRNAVRRPAFLSEDEANEA